MDKHSYTFKFSALVLGVLLSAAVISCESRGTDVASPYVPVSLNDTSYPAVRAAVLVPAQCLKCHKEFDSEEGIACDIIAGDPEHSPLYQKVKSGEMPKGGPRLSPSQVEMIRLYIANMKPGEDSGPTIDLNHVTFDVLNKEIFAPRCLKCHDEFATEEGFMPDVEGGDPKSSLLYNFVARGKMPKNGKKLSQNNLDAIELWIKSLPPPSYSAPAATYKNLAVTLFQRSCVQCHSGDDAPKKLKLDNYADIFAANDEILARLTDIVKPMPPKQSTKVPDAAVIKAFTDWYNAGTPNN